MLTRTHCSITFQGCQQDMEPAVIPLPDVQAILGHWANLADAVGREWSLKHRESFEWKLSIGAGWAHEPQETTAVAELKVVYSGKNGGTLVRTCAANIYIHERGFGSKFEGDQPKERVVASILEWLRRNAEV